MPKPPTKPAQPGAPAYFGPARAVRPDAGGVAATVDGVWSAATPERRPWWPPPTPVRWLGALFALLALAILILALSFQFSWLRQPIESYASGQLHRPVAIRGPMSGRLLSWTPSLTAERVTVGEPAWAGGGPMIEIPRLTISLDLPTLLLRGRMVLPVVAAQQPQVRMIRAADGRNNWTFGAEATPAPLRLPAIRHFTIDDGRLTLDDAVRKLHFVGSISSNERLTGFGAGRFTLVGQGTLNGDPFLAQVLGGPLINVDPDRPYLFHSDIRAGDTHAIADGSIIHPFDLGALTAKVQVSGSDLSRLYALTGLALPNSPPYDLHGDLKRDGQRYDITHLGGRVGVSDVAGSLSVVPRDGRRYLTGDLTSRRLKLADMLAIFGGAPKAALKGTVVSPAEQAMAAKLAVEHRVLPDAALDVARLRQMDADVRYSAGSVDAGPLPIRQLSLRAKLDHGLLDVTPLSMTLPQGDISGSVRIDARGATPADTVDLRLAHAQLATLFPTRKGVMPMEGGLDARVRLSGVGASVRAVAADANGTVALVIPQGQMRRATAELLGIDAKGLFELLAKDQTPTPVRCGVAEFQSRGGIMTAQRIILDTGVVQAQGTGVIDLRTETLNLSLSGKPKQFRLLRLAAPITLKRTFAQPKVGVDVGKAAGQIGVGVLLGAVVSPLAVVLPFVAAGTAKDADCGALLDQAADYGAPVRR